MLTHYNQRKYVNKEGSIVSDRYKLYFSSEYKSIKLDSDLTLDEISMKYYGTPLYYWIVGEFNLISDPFVKIKKGESLKIPLL